MATRAELKAKLAANRRADDERYAGQADKLMELFMDWYETLDPHDSCLKFDYREHVSHGEFGVFERRVKTFIKTKGFKDVSCYKRGEAGGFYLFLRI